MIVSSFVKCGIVGEGAENADVLHTSLCHLITTGQPMEDEVESGDENDYDSSDYCDTCSDDAEGQEGAQAASAVAISSDDDEDNDLP